MAKHLMNRRGRATSRRSSPPARLNQEESGLLLAHKTYPPMIQQEPKQMPDLIDDGTWREPVLARMSDVFPTNRGLRPTYMLTARAHRYAIDYIEQVPVPPALPRARCALDRTKSLP